MVSTSENQDIRVQMLDLLMGEVKKEVLELFDSTLNGFQVKIKRARRISDNKLAKDKSLTGPVIHNFTEFEVPAELSKFLEDGLNNVPRVAVDKQQVINEIETEIKVACRNIFSSLVGCQPPWAISMHNLNAATSEAEESLLCEILVES